MASEWCRSIKAFCSRLLSSTCRTMFSKINDDSVSLWGICKMMKDIHYFKINKLNEALNRQSIKAAFSQRKNLKFFKKYWDSIRWNWIFNSIHFDQRMHFYLLFEALYGCSDGCCCCCCCGWLWCGWLRCGWLWCGRRFSNNRLWRWLMGRRQFYWGCFCHFQKRLFHKSHLK